MLFRRKTQEPQAGVCEMVELPQHARPVNEDIYSTTVVQNITLQRGVSMNDPNAMELTEQRLLEANPAAAFRQQAAQQNPQLMRPDAVVPDLYVPRIDMFVGHLLTNASYGVLSPGQIERRIRLYKRTYGPFSREDEAMLDSWRMRLGIPPGQLDEEIMHNDASVQERFSSMRNAEEDLEQGERTISRASEAGERLDEARGAGLKAADRWVISKHNTLGISSAELSVLELSERERLLFYYLLENGYKDSAGTAAVFASQTGYAPDVRKLEKSYSSFKNILTLDLVGKVYELTCSLRGEIDRFSEQDRAMAEAFDGMDQRDAEDLRKLMDSIRDAVKEADDAYNKYMSHPRGLIGKDRKLSICREKQERLGICIDYALSRRILVKKGNIGPDGSAADKDISVYIKDALDYGSTGVALGDTISSFVSKLTNGNTSTGASIASGILGAVSGGLGFAMAVYSACTIPGKVKPLTAEERWGVVIDTAAKGIQASSGIISSSYSAALAAGQVTEAVAQHASGACGIVKGAAVMATSGYQFHRAASTVDEVVGSEHAIEASAASLEEQAERLKQAAKEAAREAEEYDEWEYGYAQEAAEEHSRFEEYRGKKLSEYTFAVDTERIQLHIQDTKSSVEMIRFAGGAGCVAGGALLLAGAGPIGLAAGGVILTAAALYSFFKKRHDQKLVVDEFLKLDDIAAERIEAFKTMHAGKITKRQASFIRESLRQELMEKCGYTSVKAMYTGITKKRARFLHRKIHERLNGVIVSDEEFEPFEKLIRAMGLKLDQTVRPPMPTEQMIEAKFMA